MEYKIDQGHLTIILNERIDSNNSNQTEQEILKILNEHPGKQLILDAEKLQYISSTGLRVLLRLAKGGAKDLKVINVSLRVYEIFEMTGFNRMIDIEKEMRSITVDGCPVIGRGAFGTVYRIDEDTVVKVYRNGEDAIPIIRKETDRARQAFVSGIPTAIPLDIVRVGDQYGAEFEMINAQNCNDMIVKNPALIDEWIPRYAAFLKNLHSIEFKKGELPSAKDIYLGYLSQYKSCLREDTCERFRSLLEKMPEDRHLLHGDAQLKNVMMSSGEIIMIDMDKICVGNPAFEFAALYVCYVAFNEDDPEDTLVFLGINKENASKIYHETLKAYLGNPDAALLEEAEKKIRALAYLRLFAILTIEQKDVHSDLKELQLRHTVEHIEEMADQVDELTIL